MRPQKKKAPVNYEGKPMKFDLKAGQYEGEPMEFNLKSKPKNYEGKPMRFDLKSKPPRRKLK